MSFALIPVDKSSYATDDVRGQLQAPNLSLDFRKKNESLIAGYYGDVSIIIEYEIINIHIRISISFVPMKETTLHPTWPSWRPIINSIWNF